MKYPETSRRLVEAMNEMNLTAQELADKSGVGKSSISHYVNGTNQPHNLNAGKLATVLNVNPQWLMGYECEKRPDIAYLTEMKTNQMLYELMVVGKQLNDDMLSNLIEVAYMFLSTQPSTKK